MRNLKNNQDVEDLLRGFQGPEPRPETTRRVMEEAARVIGAGAPLRRVSWIRPLAVAAGLLALLGAGAVAYLLNVGPYDQVLAGQLRVTRDGQSIVLNPGDRIRRDDEAATATQVTCRLRDGTFVKLDRGSRVAFGRPASGERAHLQMKDGRIFLRVAKARGRFVVAGAQGAVEVLGTVFGVTEQKDGMSVSVFKGRVAVRSGVGALELVNGQSAQTAAAAAEPVRTAVDPERALLWARDVTEFRNRPLGEVLDWIEANSSFTFDLPAALRSEAVTLTVSEDPMSDVIDVLCLVCGLTREIKGTTVAIRKT